MSEFSKISAQSLSNVDPNEGIILDVRTAMEHAEKHIGFGHAHVPLDELKPNDFMNRHGLDKDASVYILCRSGKRATQAAEKFVEEGYNNIKVIEGGIIACEECGHDVKGHTVNDGTTTKASTAPISLERQVRIAAGSCAAIGAGLGIIFNPLFSIIPLIVGLGLVFAGVTDRCGMALILTKAPWNKMQSPSCTSKSCKTDAKKSTEKTGQSCQ